MQFLDIFVNLQIIRVQSYDFFPIFGLRERNVVDVKAFVAQIRATEAVAAPDTVVAEDAVGTIAAIVAVRRGMQTVGLRTFVASFAADQIVAIDDIGGIENAV